MNLTDRLWEMKDLPGASEVVQDHRNLLDWSEINGTDDHLPISMRFNEGHQLSIIVYSILMVFSAIANFTVLVLIVKRRRKTPSRINTMLMHLAIADLLVTFLVMPLEIGWAATVSWRAGNAMCKIMMFFRMFGLYLSSFILICISVDRFYAVLKPLYLRSLDKRDKIMVVGAWLGATLCSIPQMFVFHVDNHPNVTWYLQCVTYGVFKSYAHEFAYFFFGMMMMYAVPLAVIIFSYSAILMEICRRTNNPYGVRYFLSVGISYAADRVIKTQKFSTLTIRRTSFFFLLFANSVIMMIQAIWGFDPNVSIINFNICIALFGFGTTAHVSNCLDLSPTYSATIFGVNQIFVSISGYGATQLVNVFTKEYQNFEHWSYVFWVLAGINLFAFVVFMVFGSAEVQRWSPNNGDCS